MSNEPLPNPSGGPSLTTEELAGITPSGHDTRLRFGLLDADDTFRPDFTPPLLREPKRRDLNVVWSPKRVHREYRKAWRMAWFHLTIPTNLWSHNPVPAALQGIAALNRWIDENARQEVRFSVSPAFKDWGSDFDVALQPSTKDPETGQVGDIVSITTVRNGQELVASKTLAVNASRSERTQAVTELVYAMLNAFRTEGFRFGYHY